MEICGLYKSSQEFLFIELLVKSSVSVYDLFELWGVELVSLDLGVMRIWVMKRNTPGVVLSHHHIANRLFSSMYLPILVFCQHC